MRIISQLVLISILVLNISFAANLPGNNIRVTYVDGLSSYWGNGVAAAIGVPGYA